MGSHTSMNTLKCGDLIMSVALQSQFEPFPVCVTCSRVSAAAAPALPVLRIWKAMPESWGSRSRLFMPVLAEGKLQPILSWLLTQALEDR